MDKNPTDETVGQNIENRLTDTVGKGWDKLRE